MKLPLLIFSLIFTLVSTVLQPSALAGFDKSYTVKNLNYPSELALANRRGLKLPGKIEKDEIERYSPSKFLKEINRVEDNPAHYQSYLYEVRDGRQEVEKAKLIAANLLYSAVESNWKLIGTTDFNDKALPKGAKLSSLLNRKLEQLYYIPEKVRKPKSNTRTYVFEVGDWGQVVITQDVRTKKYQAGKWSIDLTTVMDENRIQPEAENIAIAPAKKSEPTDAPQE